MSSLPVRIRVFRNAVVVSLDEKGGTYKQVIGHEEIASLFYEWLAKMPVPKRNEVMRHLVSLYGKGKVPEEKLMQSDASTALTLCVRNALVHERSLHDALRQAQHLDQAIAIVADYVQHMLPFHNNNPFSNNLITTALQWVDWKVVVSSLITFLGLTMPWTEEL